MQYLDFLGQVHDLLKPRTYLEIGVRGGHSMTLSSAPSIGIDPAYDIAEGIEIGPQVNLYQQTSDDFFGQENPLAALPEPALDLAFIDGLHLYEFVLRDFMNVEKYAAPGSVVIFDDVLPRTNTEAARDRETRAWTGDVWKIIPTLREVRPDLILLLVRTRPTGLLFVLGADLTNRDLEAAYDKLLAQHVDSQEAPPAEILDRTTAVYPSWVVAAPFWAVLRDQRERGIGPTEGRAELLASLQEWATSALSDKQAASIHPSLTGKPKPPPVAPVTTAAPAKATAKAGPLTPADLSSRDLAGELLRRVRPALRWRIRKTIRLSRSAANQVISRRTPTP